MEIRLIAEWQLSRRIALKDKKAREIKRKKKLSNLDRKEKQNRMKKLITIISAVIVMASASAYAETYMVKKEDCLSKIAQKFSLNTQKLFQANKKIIKNHNLIFPGQKLQIPEKGAVSAIAKSEPFPWKNPGYNKFGKRDFVKAINMMNFQEEVKTLLIAEVNSGRFVWHQIGTGDHFEQMMFGNYRIVGDVFAQWKPNRLLAARKYSVRYENVVYYLTEPLICRNWSWWSEIILPESIPEVAVEPEPIPESAPEQIPEQAPEPEPRPMALLLIPPPEDVPVEQEVRAEPEQPKELAEKTCLDCRPDFEAWVYSGIHLGVQSQNRKNWDRYYGGNISFFPCEIKLADGIFRAGPSAQFVGWNGGVEEKIGYRGDMTLFGGEAQYITGSTKDYFKVLYGTKRGKVWGETFPYESVDKNRMWAVEGGHQWWHGRKWFNEFELGFRLELADAGEKHSMLNGQPMNESAQDQSFYSVRAKTEYYTNWPFTLTAENSFGFRAFDQSMVMEPRAGVKLYDTIEFDLSYSWIEHSQNDMLGLHAILNLSKLAKSLFNEFKADSGQEKIETKEVVKNEKVSSSF